MAVSNRLVTKSCLPVSTEESVWFTGFSRLQAKVTLWTKVVVISPDYLVLLSPLLCFFDHPSVFLFSIHSLSQLIEIITWHSCTCKSVQKLEMRWWQSISSSCFNATRIPYFRDWNPIAAIFQRTASLSSRSCVQLSKSTKIICIFYNTNAEFDIYCTVDKRR